MRLKLISVSTILVFGLMAPLTWAKGSSDTGKVVSPVAGDNLLAKEIDIHLEKKMEKKTEPKEEEPGMTLEKKMPESAPEQEGTFEDDPFASETPDKAEEMEENETMEGINRAMHDVNDTIFEYFFKPVAQGYRDIMPEEGRIAVRNVFDNIRAPAKLVSSAVQGDADKSGRVASRFLINTTLGMGGMLDVAEEEYQIKNVDEDFEQAMAVRGVEAGDYVVLPVLGPTTTRGVVGKVVDTALNPLTYTGVGFFVNAAVNTTERVNETSFYVDEIDQLNKSSIDPYQAQKHFYLQMREKQIKE